MSVVSEFFADLGETAIKDETVIQWKGRFIRDMSNDPRVRPGAEGERFTLYDSCGGAHHLSESQGNTNFGIPRSNVPLAVRINIKWRVGYWRCPRVGHSQCLPRIIEKTANNAFVTSVQDYHIVIFHTSFPTSFLTFHNSPIPHNYTRKPYSRPT